MEEYLAARLSYSSQPASMRSATGWGDCSSSPAQPHAALSNTTTSLTTAAYSETVYLPTTRAIKQQQQLSDSSIFVLHNIAGMPQYADQSQEELRWQDSLRQYHSGGSFAPTAVLSPCWGKSPTTIAAAASPTPFFHNNDNNNTPNIRRKGTVLEYAAPESLDTDFTVIGQVVMQHNSNIDTNDDAEECPICLEPLSPRPPFLEKTVRLAGCGHCFHVECLDGALKNKRACPNCRQELGIRSVGKMPSGTMVITTRPASSSSVSLLGQGPQASIVIQYDFPAGRQKEFHPAPGQPYQAASFTAYLPDNTQGRHLLERLQQSFARGLSFVVGNPFGAAPSRICEWIPHISPHNLYNPEFLNYCHTQLDRVRVPR